MPPAVRLRPFAVRATDPREAMLTLPVEPPPIVKLLMFVVDKFPLPVMYVATFATFPEIEAVATPVPSNPVNANLALLVALAPKRRSTVLFFGNKAPPD